MCVIQLNHLLSSSSLSRHHTGRQSFIDAQRGEPALPASGTGQSELDQVLELRQSAARKAGQGAGDLQADAARPRLHDQTAAITDRHQERHEEVRVGRRGS